MASNQAWLVARAGGIVAWILLLFTTMLGTAIHLPRPRRPAANWFVDLHRFAATLSLVFVAIHLYGIVMDTFVGFTVTDVLVPFASAWNPWAVTWGVLALYILLAIQITSWLGRRISRGTWKAVHLSSYALAVASTAHAATAGTDVLNRLALVVGLSLCLVVAVSSAMRAVTLFHGHREIRATDRHTKWPGERKPPEEKNESRPK